MTRPKRTRKDANHAGVRDELRAAGFVVVDVADLPGDPRHNPLDLFVLRRGPEMPVVVVCSAAGVRRWFEAHPQQMAAQVEVKPGPGARFTDDEEAYLRGLGLWPPEVWG